MDVTADKVINALQRQVADLSYRLAIAEATIEAMEQEDADERVPEATD